MPLTSEQMVLMDKLLDEALPLDEAARRRWLEKLAPQYQDLSPALWKALLPDDKQRSRLEQFAALPKWRLDQDSDTQASRGPEPGARVGPYELIRLLGAGGMAQVWLARRADGAFKREVALKLPMLTRMREGLEQRFMRERDILASLEHPNIARLYDAGIDPEGLPYLSMEYVQGQPLTSWCDEKRLGIRERLALFLQVLDAVRYAHEKQVIHRDLKPSNILVTASGEVRLLDFGVAKLLEEEPAAEAQLTNVYGRALTPNYASPELLQGDPVDARSDVYSLGVLLYELLTGALPYRLKSGASLGVLVHAIATVEVSRPSGTIEQDAGAGRATTPQRLARQLRGDLDVITLKALAKEASERYASAAAMAEDLRRYLEGKPITAQPPGLVYRAGKFVRRHRVGVGVAVAFTLAVAGMVGYEVHRAATEQANGLPAVTNAKPLGEKSVAVLPFIDMSEKKDQEYFAEGLSEELINLLAQVQDLQVIARTSSFFFKGKSATVTQIAKTLGVANVLEGSVRKAGNRLRISAQLIRADNGYPLWSQAYDRDDTDIFAVQDDIARAVVAQLRLKLAPLSQSSARRTSNTEAYNQYLLGEQFYNRGTRDGFRLAIEAYRRAVALDPDYVAPHAGLALAEFYFANQTGDASGYRRAQAEADEAMALGREDASAYSARGFMRYYITWDWVGAQADLEKALALDPGDTKGQRRYGRLLATLGRLPEAIAVTKRAIELDPLSSSAWQGLAEYFATTRDFAAAHEATRRALEISPESAFVLNNVATLQLLEGRAEDALATCRKIDNEGYRLYGIAMAEHTLKNPKESQRALEELITKDAASDAFQIAEAYAWRGEKDRAFEWLERSYVQRDAGLAEIKFSPLLGSLHGDPRYQALLRKLKLPE
ncbi:MAG TPA: protein kinase [Steroidobacteraceae bacterium]|nr:protein kinase [Steroidobacteraceae bacterium]